MNGSKILYIIAFVIGVTLFGLMFCREQAYSCSVIASTPDYCFPTIFENWAAVVFLGLLVVGTILNIIEYYGEKKLDKNRK